MLASFGVAGSESFVAACLTVLQLAVKPVVSVLGGPLKVAQRAGMSFVFPGLTLYNVTPTRRLNVRHPKCPKKGRNHRLLGTVGDGVSAPAGVRTARVAPCEADTPGDLSVFL